MRIHCKRNNVQHLHCALSLQIPGQITVVPPTGHPLLPIEVIGWFARRMGVAKGDWVLVASEDAHCVLTCHIVARGPHGAAG